VVEALGEVLLHLVKPVETHPVMVEYLIPLLVVLEMEVVTVVAEPDF
jgi:hypothetical protein